MKAALLNINPDAVIVDLTHRVEKYNITMGAMILASTIKYFPKESIHIGVIDPGVGGTRKPIIVETERSLFVGPDNGLLIPAAEQEGIRHVFEITNKKYLSKEVSNTFHGRDIFAPVAGHLANGVKPSIIGKEAHDQVKLKVPQPEVSENFVDARVLYVDSFGNAITNLSEHDLKMAGIGIGDETEIEVKNKSMKLIYTKTYERSVLGQPALILGSQELVEIALNRRNAANLLGLSTGEKIRVKVKS